MNNLIPTPRTDKNGRVVVRHMRGQDENDKGRGLPPVSLPEAQVAFPSNEQIVDMIFGSSDHELVSRATQYLESYAVPKVIEAFIALVDLGSPGGTEGARRFLDEKMSSAILFQTIMSPRYTPQIMSVWAINEVREKAGIPFDQREEYDALEDIRITRQRIRVDHLRHDDVASDLNHWRGVAAFHWAGFDSGPEEWSVEDTRRFIEWAGDHDDIGMVVRIAKKRSIRNPDEMESLIAEITSHNALGEGIL